MLRLNSICCGLNLVFFRGQHCTAVEMQVIKMASAALKLTIAVSRKGRFTDMFPVSPGSLTFMRDVAADRVKTARAKKGWRLWLLRLAQPAADAAARVIAATKVPIDGV